ncbi:MAG: helix-turn-helix transcriptional regulator [Dehalobacterium sp.]|jgi:hypothetical protein
MHNDFPSRVPWNWQPHFNEICAEENVDPNLLIDAFANNESDREIAGIFNTTEKTIRHLRNHFEKYGIGSVMGQD